jgi:hypothetical protein
MLKLRRAIVIGAPPARPASRPSLGQTPEAPVLPGENEQELSIELQGRPGETPASTAPRRAIADVALVGRSQVGDEVIVNVQALDLALGSGGFDIVHVNLTRGLDGQGTPDAHVMKLNYTSLQHAVVPVDGPRLDVPLERPVAILALHGQLPAVAWAFAQRSPGLRLGFIQTDGGALPGTHSRTVRTLRRRGLLAGHLTAGAAFGGEGEAITTAGALHHGLSELGWDAAICGPGPGLVGSGSPLGHGGMAALDSAHAALALGCSTLLVARMSSSDGRPRHRRISHHTLTVLDLLLEPVTVALPAGMPSPVGAELRASLGAVFTASRPTGPALEPDIQRPARITRHDWRRAAIDLPSYATSGLPTTTMGRGLAEDPLFFAAALAGGTALSELATVPHRPDADDDGHDPLAQVLPGHDGVYAND